MWDSVPLVVPLVTTLQLFGVRCTLFQFVEVHFFFFGFFAFIGLLLSLISFFSIVCFLLSFIGFLLALISLFQIIRSHAVILSLPLVWNFDSEFVRLLKGHFQLFIDPLQLLRVGFLRLFI